MFVIMCVLVVVCLVFVATCLWLCVVVVFCGCVFICGCVLSLCAVDVSLTLLVDMECVAEESLSDQ